MYDIEKFGFELNNQGWYPILDSNLENVQFEFNNSIPATTLFLLIIVT